MVCKICKIVDNSTLVVEPSWKWSDTCGNTIKCRKIHNCLNDDISNHKKIDKLLLNKIVLLRRPVLLDSGSLSCDIQITYEE